MVRVDTEGKIQCPLCGQMWRYMLDTTYAQITVGKRKRTVEDVSFVRNTDGTVTSVVTERTVWYPHTLLGEFDSVCISEWQGKDHNVIVLDHYDGKNNIKYYKTVSAVVLKDRPGTGGSNLKDRFTSKLWNKHSATGPDKSLTSKSKLDW